MIKIIDDTRYDKQYLTSLVDRLISEKTNDSSDSVELQHNVKTCVLRCLYLQFDCCGWPHNLEVVVDHEVNRILKYYRTGKL